MCVSHFTQRWGWDHDDKTPITCSPFGLARATPPLTAMPELPHRTPRLSLLQTAVLLALGAPPLLSLVILLGGVGEMKWPGAETNMFLTETKSSYIWLWYIYICIVLYKLCWNNMLLTQHCTYIPLYNMHATSGYIYIIALFSWSEGAPLRLDCNMWPHEFGTGQWLGGDECYKW